MGISVIVCFATLVENRDDNTGGHIRRTKGYVEIILNELKKKNDYKKILTKDYINHVKNAAPMYDIGKISTPDQILQKPGKLTDEEYEIMKKHAPVGGDIIRDALPLETCFRIIWEGAGEDFDPEIVEVFLNARARVEEYYRNDGNRELNS